MTINPHGPDPVDAHRHRQHAGHGRRRRHVGPLGHPQLHAHGPLERAADDHLDAASITTAGAALRVRRHRRPTERRHRHVHARRPALAARPPVPAGMTIDNLGRLTWNPAIANIGTTRSRWSPPTRRPAGDAALHPHVAADTQAPPSSSAPCRPAGRHGPDVHSPGQATDNVGVTSLTLTATVGGVTTPIAALPDHGRHGHPHLQPPAR